AALRPIATEVVSAHVTRFHGDAVDVVALNQVVVAVDENGVVRSMINGVPEGAIAHALHLNRRGVGARPAAEVVDVAAEGKMSTGGQRFPVAAFQKYASVTRVANLGVLHAIVRTSHDRHCAIPHIDNLAVGQNVMRPAGDDDGIPARDLEMEVAKFYVR